ncbi:MAG: DNA topoisomerase IV subunit A [Candidatus Woesearchaeota archaeon]
MADVLQKIKDLAMQVYSKINKLEPPELEVPQRNLQNVYYDENLGYFEMKTLTKKRKLSVNTVKTFAQTLKMIELSKILVETDDIATKREAYYVSKNWGEARFKEQPESDAIMDDIEAMFGVNREQLGFIPEERGGDVAGELIVIDKDAEGKKLEIDCTKFGSGAYSIPVSVEHLKFQTDAEYIIAIETHGMFQRLAKHGFWKKSNSILINMGGVPTRATRRFIRRLSDEYKIPVVVFTDGDPYGWLNIYRTLKVGSGNSAHINKFFSVPNAKFIGITARDIKDYALPTHPLKDVDIKRIDDGIKNDPFVKHYQQWQQELTLLKTMKKRAEQQALATHGLNYVIDTYLPEKLANPERWLP